jgi:hypothetical protein
VKKSVRPNGKGIEDGMAHLFPGPILFQCIMLVLAYLSMYHSCCGPSFESKQERGTFILEVLGYHHI